jgi:hypothetical protein
MHKTTWVLNKYIYSLQPKSKTLIISNNNQDKILLISINKKNKQNVIQMKI